MLGDVKLTWASPRRAAAKEHLPLGVGQLPSLVDHDVRERTGEQIRVRHLQAGLVEQRGTQVVTGLLIDRGVPFQPSGVNASSQ